MVKDDRQRLKLARRELLQSGALIGTTAGIGLGATGVARATGQRRRTHQGETGGSTYVVEQGDQQWEVEALSNGQSIEDFYDMSNPAAPTGLEEADTSQLFFWDGPNEPSLGVVHDKGGEPSSGGEERVGVIDDFEDGDLSEWESLDVGSAEISSTVVRNGTYAAYLSHESPDDVSGEHTDIVSMSGLNAYPKAGDTFEYSFRVGDSGSERPCVRFWSAE